MPKEQWEMKIFMEYLRFIKVFKYLIFVQSVIL